MYLSILTKHHTQRVPIPTDPLFFVCNFSLNLISSAILSTSPQPGIILLQLGFRKEESYMDSTHTNRLGLRTISLILFLTLTKSLSSTAFDVSEYEDWESVDTADSILSYGSELGDMEENEWQMVQTKGNQFVVNDQPFYVNGFNTYWLMVFAADESTRGKVTEVFKHASSVGMSVCRTWAFNDGQWRALQKSPSVYDEDVFKALDFVVSEARKYKIRLILSLANNWEAYGGKAQYTVLNRVNTFTNITYKEDPTIFAWELMNEPRCTSDSSGDVLQDWIKEMAFYVKSIDPKHLVEIGLEGFYGPSTPQKYQFNPNSYAQEVGTDFIRNHQSWMEAHIEDAEKYLGMPVVFAEFGVSAKAPGYNSTYRDNLINTVYKTILNSTKKGGSGAGSLVWQLFPDGTDYMDDGYSIVLSKSPSTSSIISLQSTRLALFNSLCSKKCRWGCKKRNELEKVLIHDEL
ncbi:Mannan endo-1,4-beta-mannosidase 6 [Glycine max]|nr:Mannan endo-1,4-beta-mannosidase 6 [Glycine max]